MGTWGFSAQNCNNYIRKCCQTYEYEFFCLNVKFNFTLWVLGRQIHLPFECHLRVTVLLKPDVEQISNFHCVNQNMQSRHKYTYSTHIYEYTYMHIYTHTNMNTHYTHICNPISSVSIKICKTDTHTEGKTMHCDITFFLCWHNCLDFFKTHYIALRYHAPQQSPKITESIRLWTSG